MAFSGLRPESLGNHDGSDGLRLGDFVEAEIRPDGIEFTKVPTVLVVRRSPSKAPILHVCAAADNNLHKGVFGGTG